MSRHLEADLVLRNAEVVTVDDACPHAEAVAVMGDRFVAVGANTDVGDIPARRVIDLDGATIVPGFSDAHNHMAWYGLALDEIDLGPATSAEQVYAAVEERAAGLAPGEMVVGSGYDDGAFPELLDRHRLDTAAGGREVWLKHRSGHVCFVNTAMLDQIGVLDGSAVVPEGGVVVTRDGEPTGELQEQAQNLAVAQVTPYPVEDLARAVSRASVDFAREGLTHVTECGIGAGWLGRSPVELAAYHLARQRGSLRVRTRLMPAVSAFHDVGANPADDMHLGLDLGVMTGFGDDEVRVGPMKIWLDGSLLARTAAMTEDYACGCHPGAPAGYLQDDADTMREQILRLCRAGWDVAAHAIGDAAVDFALDVFEEAARGQQAALGPPRHRIEHAGVASDAQIARMARLGVTPVPQMRFIAAFGDAMASSMGDPRSELLYRHRSFLDAGCRVPGSSDRPVAEGAPLLAMASMQDRLTASGRCVGPDERVDAATALRA